eukprot:COSAG05_NODE_24141_length_253_cov_1.064935_1_plen_41_part_10
MDLSPIMIPKNRKTMLLRRSRSFTGEHDGRGSVFYFTCMLS